MDRPNLRGLSRVPSAKGPLGTPGIKHARKEAASGGNEDEQMVCALLRVPKLLVMALGFNGNAMRKEVALFGYGLYMGVTQPQNELPMPPSKECKGPRKVTP